MIVRRPTNLLASLRADFREVGIIPYIGVASQLAGRNMDVSIAIFKFLEQPDVEMSWVPGFSFKQESLVAYLLMQIDQKFWADSAIERIASEEDPTGQQTLLRLLWYAQTDFADSELAAFAKNSTKPAPSRGLAQELLAREPRIDWRPSRLRKELYVSSGAVTKLGCTSKIRCPRWNATP